MPDRKTLQPLLWLDDHRGIYIPRDFARSFVDRDKHVAGVDAEEWATLDAGPDAEWYWEAWQAVCDNAVVTDDNGVRYTLYQDGALWLIPEGMEWSDETEFFAWPDEEEEKEEEEEGTRMSCDQCEMLSINGVACHETGCPNARKEWDGERWVNPASDEPDEEEEDSETE